MGLSDVLDKVTGVSTGLGNILDSTKTPKTTSEPAAQPRANGPVAASKFPGWVPIVLFVLALALTGGAIVWAANKANP